MNEIALIIMKKVSETLIEILAMYPVDKAETSAKQTALPPTEDPPETAAPPLTIVKESPPPLTDPSVKLDPEGIPWDERIHPESKARLAKGDTWKLKRGLDPVFVAKIKTELKLAQSGQNPPILTSPPETEGDMTWAQLLDAITDAQIAAPIVKAACVKFSAANIGKLQDTPILVPMVAEELGLA